ncbi:MAG: hypothetical protein IT207_04340 [Fimbriimonadaceae bacterium]|nr:hypothetical protein [Fimbriimonadaceae bacterium]
MSPRTVAKVYLVLLPLHLCVALSIRGRTPQEEPVFAEYSEAEQAAILGYVEPMAAAGDLLRNPSTDEELRQVYTLWVGSSKAGRLKTIAPLEVGARSQISAVDEINQTLGRLMREAELAAARAETEHDYSGAARWALTGMELSYINRGSSYVTLRRGFEYEAKLAPVMARAAKHLGTKARLEYANDTAALAGRKVNLGFVALRMGSRQSKQLLADGDSTERQEIVRKYRDLSQATASHDMESLQALARGGSISQAALELRLAANTAKVALIAKARRDRIVEAVRLQLIASLPLANS